MDPIRDEPGSSHQSQEPTASPSPVDATSPETGPTAPGETSARVPEAGLPDASTRLDESLAVDEWAPAPMKLDPTDEENAPNGPAGIESAPPPSRLDSLAHVPDSERPTFLFFGVVAAISLISDIVTKVWAEVVINQRGFEPIKIVGDNLQITLAYNQGGAWGLFSTADPMLRKPFFLMVSAFAIFFIISLYSRLHPSQRALKWGLPLVLGGALGNLSDRITRSQVIDFIDYHADWVMSLNSFVHKYVSSWAVTDHWPTFNVADIAICIGVGLMAVDMFTHRPRGVTHSTPPAPPPQIDSPPATQQVAQ